MTSIDLTDFPVNPKGNELDSIMELVSRKLGETWTAAKVSGYWLFYKTVDGHRLAPIQSRRNFSAALADATGIVVTRLVPVR